MSRFTYKHVGLPDRTYPSIAIDHISKQVTVQLTREFGRPIVVPDSTIISVLDTVVERNHYTEHPIDQTIRTIVSEVSSELMRDINTRTLLSHQPAALMHRPAQLSGIRGDNKRPLYTLAVRY